MTRIVAPFRLQRLSESDTNNGLSPGYLNLLSNEVYICPGLLRMVFWQAPYLAKGRRPDYNNGLGADSNSDPIFPSVYFGPT